MTERTEPSNKQEYSALAEPDKVRAILGAVTGPVTREEAFALGGINYEQLDDDQKRAVDTAFSQEGVDVTDEGEETKYRLNDDEREALGSRVDMTSVHHVIADVLLNVWEKQKKGKRKQ